MLPLQQRGELFFHISADHKIPEDQILSSENLHHLHHHHHDVGYCDNHHHEMETGRFSYYRESDDIVGGGGGDDINMGDCPKKRRSSSVSSKKLKQCGGSRSGSGDNRKKMMHRDIERQRRQDMATLYSSLRSLLPLEFIKGKRSISDQVNESVNYIKHLQRNIKELSSKRDELMWSSSSSSGSFNSIHSSNENSGNVVVVRPSLVGVEVVYSSSSNGPRLSSLLHVLLEQGLSVLSCISSKVDDQLIHSIMGEVKDSAGFEISDLQDRLKRLI